MRAQLRVIVTRRKLLEWRTARDAQRTVLSKFDIYPDESWDWRKIAVPFVDDDLRSTQSFRSWLRSYLDSEVREAGKGNVAGPRKAALDVLRDLRNEIRLLVDHGGLSGDSYRDELQRWYMPLNAHLSIGPPAERIEQFAARNWHFGSDDVKGLGRSGRTLPVRVFGGPAQIRFAAADDFVRERAETIAGIACAGCRARR